MRLIMATTKTHFDPLFALCDEADDPEEIADSLLEQTGDYCNALWGNAPLSDKSSIAEEIEKFHQFFDSYHRQNATKEIVLA